MKVIVNLAIRVATKKAAFELELTYDSGPTFGFQRAFRSNSHKQ